MAPSRRSIKTTFSSNNNFGASVDKDSKSKSKSTPTANPINVVKLGAAPVPAPPALPKTKTSVEKGVAITVQPTNVAPAAKDTARATNADSKACAPFVGKSTSAEAATGAVSKAILAHTQAQGQAISDEPDPTSFTSIGAQVQAHEIEVLEKAVIVEKKQQATALPPSTEGDVNADITSSSANTQRTDHPEHEARERDSDSDPDPLLLPLPAVHLPLLPSELEQRDLRAYEHARQRVKRAGEREALVARRAARKGVGAGDVRSSTMLISSTSPVSAPSNGGVGTTTSTSTAVCAAPVSTSTSVSVSVSVFSKLGFGFGRKGGSKEGKKNKDEKKEAAAALAQAQGQAQAQTQVKSKSKTIPPHPIHTPTHTQGESKILKKLGKGSFNLARDQVGFLNHHDGEEDEDEEDSEDSDGPNSTSTAPRTREVLLSDLVVNRKGMRMRIEDEFEMVPSLRTVIVLDEEDGMLVARDEDDDEGEDEDGEEGDEWECISRDGGERDKEREAPLSYAQVVLGAV